ncbi:MULTISPECIES: Shedu immune nuclease family protein [Paenibacillus]|uniref:Shedu immune nuclease family protein n=1 Tax=Paenibacillus TaxID=44249 RepID=UPI000B8876B3|nr:Shedu immune nuclease family protein [Paenibacillus amylolyticus]
MIKFEVIGDEIIAQYTPRDGLHWITKKFDDNEMIAIGKTFYFEKNDLYKEIDLEEFTILEEVQFSFAKLEGDYFRVKKTAIRIENELLIHKNIKFQINMFKTFNNISIFRRIFDVIEGDLSIGPKESDLPVEEFNKLLKIFPNSTEVRKYSKARISQILKEYVNTKREFVLEYNSYMSKKLVGKSIKSSLNATFAEYEVKKYQYVLERLKYMLKNENGYTESDWQNEIIDVLLLIYPKYIQVFKEVKFRDEYSLKQRRLDYMLIDSSGNIDVVEIKKPNYNALISQHTYRDNYVPVRELSGTIMQVEKYLFHLNKSGRQGEKDLTNKYREFLPNGFEINITSPSAIIILGREKELNGEQLRDLEVIKRKYKNVMDIVTYDDLIRRLEGIIGKFQNQLSELDPG